MPKFDTSTIDGFDAMTADEKVAALLGWDIPEAVDMSLYVSKETFDKKASEAASLARQLKGKPSDDDITALRNELATTKETVETFQKEKTIAEWTARYLELGYEKELAKKTAEAMQSGDMETVFANGEKHRATLEAKIKADLMKSDPKPGGAGGNGDENDSGIEQAKRIGKAKAAANQTTADVMKHYI